MIKAKWKRMSIELHFSSYEGEAEALFNTVGICGSADVLERELEAADAVLWYPFENMNWTELLESIDNTARLANQYDEVPA